MKGILMKEIRIYRCEDSVDGIFTAVYDAWASKYGHDYIKLEVMDEDACSNFELFSDYLDVKTDLEKSQKVARTIKNKISDYAYEMLIHAALSNDKRKADSIYHFIVIGLSMGEQVTRHLANPYVANIFEINRNVGNELHHYKGFLRFHEINDNLLLAKFEPKNSIVELITPHFAERLSQENFIILDIKRRLASIHQRGLSWYMTLLSKHEMDEILSYSNNEEEYESLWRTFFKNIAISERENYVCQRNHAPLHLRKYMIEFQDINSNE